MKYNNTNFGPRLEKSWLTSSFFLIKYNSNNNLALWSLKTNNLMFNNIKFKSFIHSSSILKSDRPNPNPQLDRLLSYEDSTPQTTFSDPSSSTNVRSPILEAVARLERERLSNLKLIKYQGTPTEEEEDHWATSTSSSSTENYPDVTDAAGRIIDINQPISMFEGVHLVAQYLRGRYHINPDLISETKITEILKIFDKNGGTITVAEIFEHMSDLYKEDKNFYSEKQTTQTENLSENLNILDSNTSKPFGQYGEVTLNQIGGVLKEKLKDVNWDQVYEKTQLTVNGAPVVVNAIGYGIVLKNYMKYVHNRPMDVGLSPQQIEAKKLMRNRQLVLFCIFGAPLTMILLRTSAISFKDMFSLSIGGDSPVANSNSNSNSNTINSILFLSYLNKKIPKWLKIFFKILFVTILVLKLYGFSIGSVFVSLFSINVFYLKLAYYILFSLIICFHLLNLYLLHKFSNKNMKILEVLPEFIIKWLKEIELMSTSKPGIKEFKTNCYMQITVYLLLMSTTIIAANLV